MSAPTMGNMTELPGNSVCSHVSVGFEGEDRETYRGDNTDQGTEQRPQNTTSSEEVLRSDPHQYPVTEQYSATHRSTKRRCRDDEERHECPLSSPFRPKCSPSAQERRSSQNRDARARLDSELETRLSELVAKFPEALLETAEKGEVGGGTVGGVGSIDDLREWTRCVRG